MEEIERIRTRDQIPTEDTWKLEDLYATDADWETELATLAEDQKTLSAFCVWDRAGRRCASIWKPWSG